MRTLNRNLLLFLFISGISVGTGWLVAAAWAEDGNPGGSEGAGSESSSSASEAGGPTNAEDENSDTGDAEKTASKDAPKAEPAPPPADPTPYDEPLSEVGGAAYQDPFAFVEEQAVTPEPSPAPSATPSAIPAPSPTAPAVVAVSAKPPASLPKPKPFTLALVDAKEQTVPGIAAKHAVLLTFYPEGARPKYSVTRKGGYSGTIDVFLSVEAVSGGKKRLVGKYSEEEYDAVLGSLMVDYDSVKRRFIYGLNKNGIQISVPALLAAGGGLATAHVLFYLATTYGVESEWRLIRWASKVPNLYKKLRDRYYHRIGAVGSVAQTTRVAQLLDGAFKLTWVVLENAAVAVPTYQAFKSLLYKVGLSEEQTRVGQASSVLTCAHTLYKLQLEGRKPSLHECAMPLSSLSFGKVTEDLSGIPLENGMTYGEYADALAEEGVEADIMANPAAIEKTPASSEPAPDLVVSGSRAVYPVDLLDREVLPAVELVFSDRYYREPSLEIENLVDQFNQGAR